MKKFVRFFAFRRGNYIDLAVIGGFVALLDADRIAWAFVALIVGAVVSLIAEEVSV